MQEDAADAVPLNARLTLQYLSNEPPDASKQLCWFFTLGAFEINVMGTYGQQGPPAEQKQQRVPVREIKPGCPGARGRAHGELELVVGMGARSLEGKVETHNSRAKRSWPGLLHQRMLSRELGHFLSLLVRSKNEEPAGGRDGWQQWCREYNVNRPVNCPLLWPPLPRREFPAALAPRLP